MSKNEELKDFFKVCRLDELSEKRGKKFLVNDVEIALFKIDENVYALNNICTHLHASIIFDGFIEDDCVVCPAHGWEYRLKDGKRADGRKGLDSYQVKIVESDVYVKVFKKIFNW